MTQPPSDVDAEQSILGACFLNTDYLARVLGQVTEDDYSRNAHRLIHNAIRSVNDQGGIDEILVNAYLADHKQLDEVGAGYVFGLLDATSISIQLDRQIERVKELAARRRIITLSIASIEQAQAGDKPSVEILHDLATAADNANAGHHPPRRTKTYTDLIVEWHQNEKDDHEGGGILTGLPSLDRQLGTPLRRGEVVLVAARSGSGKTWMLLHLLTAALQRRRDGAALVVSLEMLGYEVAHRLLSQTSSLSPDSLSRSALTSSTESVVSIATANGEALQRARFVDSPSSLEDLPRDLARMRKEGLDPHLVALDYLGLIKPRRGENPKSAYDRMSTLAVDLKALAKQERVVILAAAQLSRDSVQEGKRPSVEKLRDSGQIEEAADRIIGLWDPAKNQSLTDIERVELRGEVRVCVLKNRKGIQDSSEISLRYTSGLGLYEPANPDLERLAA